MINRIEARNFRCLKSVAQELRPLEVLVGPNGSGKSALMDAVSFLGTLTADGLQAAVTERTKNFYDLVWGLEGGQFELAIEARIPEGKRVPAPIPAADTIRYEAGVRIDPLTESVVLTQEKLSLFSGEEPQHFFVIAAREGWAVTFYAFSGPAVQVQTGYHSALASLPMPEPECRQAYWLRNWLAREIRYVRLNPDELRAPSPPGLGRPSRFTGSSFARLVAHLKEADPSQFKNWIEHVRTALPDLETVDSKLRPEDNHRYLLLRFTNGVTASSWVVSEGTLRLLALTFLAYAPGFEGIYLIEEPENGVHPTAVETIYQSLSSVYEAQVLMASHSPILVSLAKPEQLLCFTRGEEGTSIVRGKDHAVLRDWKKDVSLSDLFAAGVLG